MTKVLIFGHGYIAHAIGIEAVQRGWEIYANDMPCSRLTFYQIQQLIGSTFDLVVNAAAFIPESGRVADCDKEKDKTLLGNLIFPKMVAEACDINVTPLIHISTGCIFDEQHEYNEDERPTRGWDGHCGTYVGSKLLAEKVVMDSTEDVFVLRIRLPFDNLDHPRNYLNKLMEFKTVYRHWNSLTHRGEFARAALDLFDLDCPRGIYHVANQGQISAEEVCDKLVRAGIMRDMPEFIDHHTYGCRLSTRKLCEAGVMMRPVDEAVDDAIKNWSKRHV